MAHDLILGQTRRSFAIGALEPGARGYAPSKWITPAEAEAMVAALVKPSGFFSPGLPRDRAEQKVRDHLRAKKIGIISEGPRLDHDVGHLVAEKLRERPRKKV